MDEGPEATELGSLKKQKGVQYGQMADRRVDGWMVGRVGRARPGRLVKELGYFPKATGVHWKHRNTMDKFLF